MTTIFFIGSLIAIFAMISTKILQSYTGKVYFTSSVFEKTDSKIYEFIGFCVYKYNRYKKITKIFIFEFLPSYMYEVLIKLKDYVAKRYYIAGDQFRGKRMLRNKGSVSNFLKNITEDKSKNKKDIV
ncbi:MAG: hypothetical protein WC095_02805 [Candidatus Paceibacterota bacterium]